MAESKLNPRERARLEEQEKKKKARKKYIWIGLAALLVLAVILFVNSSLFYNGVPALKVDGTNYTVADVNYEYQKGYMQFTQSYGDYVSMFIDSSKPLSEQASMFDADGGTWDEYFKNLAEENLIEKTVFYKDALEAGYKLTDEEAEEIDSTISNYNLYAGLYGYTLDGYLAANYGAGNSEKTIREHMAKELIIERYLQDVYNSYEYSDQELDEYYAENADVYDRVKVLYYNMSDTDDVDSADAVQSIVDLMAEPTEEEFRSAVLGFTGNEATETSYTRSSFMSLFGGSITEDQIAEGFVFTHDADTSAYAVYIRGVEDNNYNTVSVRHILIKANDEDGDGVYSDEEKDAALNRIIEIQQEWQDGVATEESFGGLAILYSDDAGSAAEGGLYEGIYKGQMVSEFDAFCFDKHSHGDTGIVYGESSSYAGYHLIYFVSADGQLYSRMLAENGMRSDAYNEYLAAATEGVEARHTFMWRYVMKDK